MSERLIKAEELRRIAAKLFEGGGLRPEDAAVIACDLVEANLRGLDSHGVSRIPMYLERIRRGVVNPQPNISVHQVSAAVSLVDGDDGMGFLVAHRAMDEAIALAAESGIGLVGVRRSTHYGMAALYVKQAIEKGYIALAYTNSSPALPVWGGRTAFLGASPFAAGVPGGKEVPYVLDMAMTVIARGKIRMAALHGEPIPQGLALDSDGAPTTNAQKAFEGVCLPFGGAKGAALAMLMDLLAGVLTGANYGGAVKSLYYDHSEPQNVGHLFLAIRPDLFMTREEFGTRMDTFVAKAKSSPLAQGFEEILIPGEPEERTAAIRLQTGIPISDEVVRELLDEGARLGLDLHEYCFRNL
ncbi:Ldh family oxidoreductase [Brevibacillus fulvus]|uniref:LDH2 family malate/lactate/ureidoglycolate dehydrogenase n=1 Tax=Brevibacillus fulvus TaxID=1125967 RepID=A0A938Y3M2_9BACL|nr:Ldh family oxidoreductase [Brevibacillus fulvus]MBM7591351.1 LDH2 family malate/lactate/ureidoglycolate dehydrogenase [Brevibacillus fulvus]